MTDEFSEKIKEVEKEIAEMEQDIKEHPIQGRMMEYPIKELKAKLQAFKESKALFVGMIEKKCKYLENTIFRFSCNIPFMDDKTRKINLRRYKEELRDFKELKKELEK